MNASNISPIRVAATSSPYKVAGAIANIVREKGNIDVQSIGTGAINQSIKAIVYARRYLDKDHLDLVVVPEMVTLQIDDKERTAILLHVSGCAASANK